MLGVKLLSVFSASGGLLGSYILVRVVDAFISWRDWFVNYWCVCRFLV